jgi:hypothetical protein
MRNDPYPLHEPGGLGIFALLAKALTPPPYQPNFPARRDRHGPATPASGAAPARPRGVMERLEHWFWSRRQRDVEAYLGRSKDLHELEARMRDLNREPWRPYY